jgi:hypothetical protein
MADGLCIQISIIQTIKFVVLALIIYALVNQFWDWISTWIKERLGYKDDSCGKFKILLIILVLTIIAFIALKTNPVFILGVNSHCLSLEK